MHIADHFALHYYRWSLERAKEECRSGFPLLSLVKGTHAFTVLEVVQTLSPEAKEQFSVALVKRFHPRAAALGAFHMSPEEHRLVDLYLNHGYKTNARGETCMLPFASERERAVKEGWESGDSQKPRRTAVKRLVARALQSCGYEGNNTRAGELIYQNAASGWIMQTHIDFGHTWKPMISYAHVLIPPGQQPLVPDVHICGWMGIAGQTQWDLFTDQETEEVAQNIATLIRWFGGCWQDLIPRVSVSLS
jgi:hypothetical protein